VSHGDSGILLRNKNLYGVIKSSVVRTPMVEGVIFPSLCAYTDKVDQCCSAQVDQQLNEDV